MTDKEDITCNKLIAAGGWLRRARRKWWIRPLQGMRALKEAEAVIDGAIELVRSNETDARKIS